VQPFFAATATTSVLALALGSALWFFGGHAAPRFTLLLALTGTTGIAGTRLGGWGQNAITWANNQIGKVLGALFGRPNLTEPGTILWAVGALVLLLFVGFAFWKKQIDDWVMVAALLTPFAVSTIPGEAGNNIYTGVKFVAGLVSWPIALLFGLT
jgi:hypothetical protein